MDALDNIIVKQLGPKISGIKIATDTVFARDKVVVKAGH